MVKNRVGTLIRSEKKAHEMMLYQNNCVPLYL